MVQCNKEGRDRHYHEYRLTVSLVGRAVIMYYQDLQTDFIVHLPPLGAIFLSAPPLI
jgi:hypothetical protein